MVRIKKVYDKNYTVIGNTSINDSGLYLADKGMLEYLWSKPDDWNFYAREVAKHQKDGIDGVNTALRHLEENGYLYRGRVRNEKGQLKGSKWLLSETPKKEWSEYYQKKCEKRKKKPKVEKPIQAKPKQAKPKQENPELLNTNQTKYSSNKIKNFTKSLSKEEKERDQELIEILINYLNEFANRWRREPITFSEKEYDKLVKAVHGKDVGLLRKAAEKTVIYSEQYPQGYLLNCIKNLPDMKEESA